MQPHPRKTQPSPMSRVATGTQPAKHKGHKVLIHLAGKEVHRGLLRFDSWRFSLKLFKDRWVGQGLEQPGVLPVAGVLEQDEL